MIRDGDRFFMNEALTILVADYVPLANKGEEAILRGIEDMLSNGRPVRLGILGRVPEPVQQGHITVFPCHWIFRSQGRTGLSLKRRLWLDVVMATQMRFRDNPMIQRLVSFEDNQYEPLRTFFRQADIVLVGHDGVFGTESCAVIHLAKQAGKRTGILGASAGLGKRGRYYKGWLYKRALWESDFCVFRERFAWENLRRVGTNPKKLILAPDPAFAMQAAAPEAAQAVLQSHPEYNEAKTMSRPIVAVTVLETGRVYAQFRPDLTGVTKCRAHALYVAGILEELVTQANAFIVFLPHSVEAGASDITAAEHVREAMGHARDHTMILDQEGDARLLKAMIRECHFLVGQRTHSLIGAVSVGTPFVALTNHKDTRTHGIIGHMCECMEQIIDMDLLNDKQARQKAYSIFSERGTMRQQLRHVGTELMQRLQAVARLVRGESVC
jgi:polysaccharide pyruvyl transferase WcaK-like protein